MTKTDFGWINTSNIADYSGSHDVAVYLQGYRIDSLSSYARNYLPVFVIHLDSNKFNSRVPDRTQLTEGSESCRKEINDFLLATYQDFLLDRLAELGKDLFAHKYWDQAKAYLPREAKKLPIPIRYIQTPSSSYYVTEDGSSDFYSGINEDFAGMQSISVDNADILRNSFLHETGCLDYVEYSGLGDCESRSLLCHNFMHLNQSSFISPSDLPDGHWALDFLLIEDDITGVEVGVSGETKSGQVLVYGISIPTEVGTTVNLTLHMANGSSLAAKSPTTGVYHGDILFLPKSLNYYDDLLRAIFTFSLPSDHDYEFDESAFESTLDEFLTNISGLMSNDIDQAIRSILSKNKAVFAELGKIFGKHSVSFNIDEHLNIVVEAAA